MYLFSKRVFCKFMTNTVHNCDLQKFFDLYRQHLDTVLTCFFLRVSQNRIFSSNIIMAFNSENATDLHSWFVARQNCSSRCCHNVAPRRSTAESFTPLLHMRKFHIMKKKLFIIPIAYSQKK